ncbi:MAG: hypothetical protein LQ350_007979 [Teloschistes chrysophthalmus]|nr:MAG: hypothetical protein LQ350_007979 [Niorma chrysophthalma]
MAETVLGVLGLVGGLAGLFKACINSVEKFEIARAQDGDLGILSAKLDNQKVLFSVWGHSVGLLAGDDQRAVDRMSEPVRQSIARTISLIQKLFEESDVLRQRYKLDIDQELNIGSSQSSALSQLQNSTNGTQTAKKRHHVVRWVIKDQVKFKELVQNFRELVEDLERLTNSSETLAVRARVLRRSMIDWPWERLQASELAGQDYEQDSVSVASAEILDQRTVFELPGSDGEQQALPSSDDSATHHDEPNTTCTPNDTPSHSHWDRLRTALADSRLHPHRPSFRRLFSSDHYQKDGRSGDVCWREFWEIERHWTFVTIIVYLAEELQLQVQTPSEGATHTNTITIKDFRFFLKLNAGSGFAAEDLTSVNMRPAGMRMRWPRLAVTGDVEDLVLESGEPGGRGRGEREYMILFDAKKSITPGYFKPFFRGVETAGEFRRHDPEGRNVDVEVE